MKDGNNKILHNNITLGSLLTLTGENISLDTEAEERDRGTEGNISFKTIMQHECGAISVMLAYPSSFCFLFHML